MKVTIAYLPTEEGEAALAALLQLYPGAKVRKSERHPPFKHIYLTTKKAGNPCGDGENSCTIPPDMV